MKILFITSTYLGDAVISSGILNALLKKYPQGQFTICCGPVPAPLFEDFPNLKKIIILKKVKYSLHWFKLWRQCLYQKWDLVVDIRGTALSYFLRAKKRYIWKTSTLKLSLKVHQLSHFMGFEQTPWNKIWISDTHFNEAKKLLPQDVPTTYIAFSLSANWDKKCWPIEYYQKLALKLVEDTINFPNPYIVLFGAPQQQEYINQFLKNLTGVKVINLVGKIHLLTVAACLKSCQLFVGNDSGLMHLAAAVDTPTLGIFGPSPIQMYAPWGPKVNLVFLNQPLSEINQLIKQGQNVMENISVKKVEIAIYDLLGIKEGF